MEVPARARRWGRQKPVAGDGITPLTKGTVPTGHAPVAAVDQATTQVPPVPITAEQLDKFVTDGFLVLRPRVPVGTHESVAKVADAAYKAADFNGQQNSSPIGNNILAEVPQLQAVFGAPEVDAALRGIVGDNYIVHPHRRPHQNDPGSFAQTLHKDSHAGFEVHRSHMPWIVMAMYYPQAVLPEGAPTSLCAGTQFYAGEERFDARHMGGDAARETLQRWGSQETPMTCDAGTVVIVHNDLWHRGTANRSDRRRWMFCFMFMRALPPPAMLRPVPEPAGHAVPSPRHALCRQVLRWLEGRPGPASDADVWEEEAKLLAAQDDQPRLHAAYALAAATDAAGASAVLARVLREAATEPVRRAAKFGAAAACHRQLLSGRTDMVCELLEVIEGGSDPGAVACAARALHECGAWAVAPPALCKRAASALAVAAEARRPLRPLERGSPGAGSEADGVRPPGAGSSLGRVTVWKATQDCGFIQPVVGGEDVFVASAAFGGGELIVGMNVWYDVTTDPRTGKRCAARVAGPAVSHDGGRRVGCRNVRASALEALAVLPQGPADPTAEVAARALARALAVPLQAAQRMVGDRARQEDGEALMAAALGSVRLVASCGGAVSEAAWWHELRRGLVSLVHAAAAARQQGEARAPGAGGRPGADNGLRYALAYSLEALHRSGEECALMEALAALPEVLASLAEGRPTREALLFRRCHLTTRDHTF